MHASRVNSGARQQLTQRRNDEIVALRAQQVNITDCIAQLDATIGRQNHVDPTHAPTQRSFASRRRVPSPQRIRERDNETSQT